MTFDERVVLNTSPIVDTYEDRNSIRTLNSNFIPRGIKFLDFDYAMALF
jgi:hypothetical protein